MAKNVLITGAAGFIGSNLLKRFNEEGWVTWAVDDMSNGHVEFLEGQYDPTRSWLGVDFTGSGPLKAIRDQKFDVVCHLAAVPRVSYSVEHPIETNDTNVSKTLALIDACRGNIERFVFSSSSSVYGGADMLPTSEMRKKNPKSPYALQKSIIEDYLKLYAELYDLESTALRYFNVFGPNQLGGTPYATAIANWLTNVKLGAPLRSDGDGSQSRDMCYVDNVTQANILAANYSGRLNATAFNIACGDRTTNAEILNEIVKRWPTAQVQHAKWRPGDVMHTQADITLAHDVLGYEPEVRFWDGFERTVKWFDETDMLTRISARM